MLLDEPFSALDAALRESTREMVGEVLSAAGVTTILVTHDQVEALSFADHLALMRDGRVVQAGPPQDLYLAPYDEAAARFLGEAIILEADLAGGLARSPMGWIAVAEMNRKGSARIMIRPEQIAMRVTEEGAETDAAKGRVVATFPRGPTTRVVIEPMWLRHQTTITLTASSVSSPPIGAIVQLDLLGTAHVFVR
jgi:iron(III) transport system ATP-binding protein